MQEVQRANSPADPKAGAEQRPRQDEWRWVPDPAEIDVPAPRKSRWPSGAVLLAFAWANLH